MHNTLSHWEKLRYPAVVVRHRNKCISLYIHQLGGTPPVIALSSFFISFLCSFSFLRTVFRSRSSTVARRNLIGLLPTYLPVHKTIRRQKPTGFTTTVTAACAKGPSAATLVCSGGVSPKGGLRRVAAPVFQDNTCILTSASSLYACNIEPHNTTLKLATSRGLARIPGSSQKQANRSTSPYHAFHAALQPHP
jgi:hypothetical protein